MGAPLKLLRLGGESNEQARDERRSIFFRDGEDRAWTLTFDGFNTINSITRQSVISHPTPAKAKLVSANTSDMICTAV